MLIQIAKNQVQHNHQQEHNIPNNEHAFPCCGSAASVPRITSDFSLQATPFIWGCDLGIDTLCRSRDRWNGDEILRDRFLRDRYLREMEF